MSEKISQKIRSFLVSTLTQSTKNLTPPAWKPVTYFSTGSQVVANSKIYIAVTTGTTSNNEPSHTTGVGIDGTVQWLYVSQSVDNTDISSNLYLGIGKPDAWNETDTPDVAISTPEKEKETLEDLLTLIRLNSTYVRMGLKKETWENAKVFSKFDPNVDPSLYGTTLPSFYTTIENETDINVYKCIDNNNGAPSTDAPTGEQLGYVLMSDGYIWKYMGTVESIDEVPFSTEDFYPINKKFSNDGSTQWQVQEQAQQGSVSSFGEFVSTGSFDDTPIATVIGAGSGATAGVEFNNPETGVYDLVRVWCATGGSGYDNETYAVVKNTTNSEGDGASVSLTITDGAVSIAGFVGGNGYTHGACLVIVGDGQDATGTVTVSSGVVSVVEIANAGTGYTWAKGFIIPGTSGAVGKALMAPTQGHGKDIVAELGVKTFIISLQVSESLKPYIVDGEYRQVSLISSVQPKEEGKNNATFFIGPKHPDYEDSLATQDKYQEGSGHLLFINNFEAVTHSSEQEEVIKIALTF